MSTDDSSSKSTDSSSESTDGPSSESIGATPAESADSKPAESASGSPSDSTDGSPSDSTDGSPSDATGAASTGGTDDKTAKAETPSLTKKSDAPASGSEPAVSAAKSGASASAKRSSGRSGVERRDGSKVPWPLLAAAASVGLIGALVALGVFVVQSNDRGDELAAADEATLAACQFGRTVSTYDYSKGLDDYFTAIKGGATGDFLKEFSDAGDALKDAMVKAQVKSWVDDVQCGFQSGDTEQAKALVTLTQFRTNFTQPTADRQYVVVIADMKNEDGVWKVAKLDSPLLDDSSSAVPGAGAAPGGAAPAPTGEQAPAPAPAPAPGG